MWKDQIRLKKVFATLGEELPPAESLPAKHKEQRPDPTKRDASREEFGRRALAGGKMWESLSCLLTLLECFNKNNLEMGTDSVARQMHQKTVQQYWVNIVKQQVTAGGCSTLRHVNSTNGDGFESNHVFDRHCYAKRLASIRRNTTQSLNVSSTKTVKWRLNGCNLARASR